MSILIRNGQIVTAAETFVGDIYTEGEQIIAIGKDLKYNADKRAGKIAKKAKSGTLNSDAKDLKPTDDLTRVEGIGPKIAKLLGIAGINSYGDLANSQLSKLQDILAKGGSNYATHDPSSWSQQAELAAAAKWDELNDLQKRLIGGVSSEEE